MKLVRKDYVRLSVNDFWGAPVKVTTQENYSRDDWQKKVVDWAPMMKALGGRERHEKNIVFSTSPDGLEQTVFILEK